MPSSEIGAQFALSRTRSVRRSRFGVDAPGPPPAEVDTLQSVVVQWINALICRDLLLVLAMFSFVRPCAFICCLRSILFPHHHPSPFRLSHVYEPIPIHCTNIGVTGGSRNIRQEKALWEPSRAAAR